MFEVLTFVGIGLFIALQVFFYWDTKRLYEKHEAKMIAIYRGEHDSSNS